MSVMLKDLPFVTLCPRLDRSYLRFTSSHDWFPPSPKPSIGVDPCVYRIMQNEAHAPRGQRHPFALSWLVWQVVREQQIISGKVQGYLTGSLHRFKDFKNQ